MFPRVELEGVSTACANVSALTLNVLNINSSVDEFDSHLRALEATASLEVGGWKALSINEMRNKNRQSGSNVSGGNGGVGIVDIP